MSYSKDNVVEAAIAAYEADYKDHNKNRLVAIAVHNAVANKCGIQPKVYERFESPDQKHGELVAMPAGQVEALIYMRDVQLPAAELAIRVHREALWNIHRLLDDVLENLPRDADEAIKYAELLEEGDKF